MENNLAVLIDFENIAAGTEKEGLGRFDVDALMQRVKDKGRVLVARSYADWGRFSRFKQTLLSANITMMELTSHGMQDKNRADIALVVDALELAFTRSYLDTFVIVSGDSDFTPMVLKMRELNKRVIGIGTRGSTSRLLIQACDEFMYYDSIISRPEPPRRGDRGMNASAAYKLLVEALEGLQREDPETPLASIAKTAMLRKSPDFSEADLGYGSFAKFLEAAQDKGVIRLSRDPKSGGYRVDHANGHTPSARGESAARDITEDDDAPRSGGSRGARAASQPAAAAVTEETWEDPYLPQGVAPWIEVLSIAGIDPLAAPTRLAILEQLEDLAADRKGRRRKVTIGLARDEIKKRLRRTHPDLPLEAVKGVLNALLLAGLLIHRDGSGIRTGSAPFVVTKNSTGLNDALLPFYLAHLRAEGCDLTDTSRLAELFLGSPERRREVEEQLAWLAAPPEEAKDLDDLDLDDLLVFDDAAARERTLETEEVESTVPSIPKRDVRAPAASPAPRSPAPRSTSRKRDASLPPDLDDLLTAAPGNAPSAGGNAPSAPAKAPSKAASAPSKAASAPSKAASAPSSAPSTDLDTVDLTADDEKAKPKRRRRTRKKAEDEISPVMTDELDALLE
ncbi:MAG: NYN domain-containing protein [Deltaproteobacteria bacterium]|nr:NYN domain-containing protein [Deltaproteobacteria bacterium]